MSDVTDMATFLDHYDAARVDIMRREAPLEEHLVQLLKAVRFTPYVAARLSHLLDEVLHEDDPLPLPIGLIDVLAEFIADLVLPACWGGQYENKHMRTAGKMVLEAFSWRPELTGTAITTVLRAFLKVAYPHPHLEGVQSGFLEEDILRDALLYLFRSPNCPVPVAGSFWRVVMYREPRLAFEMHGALLTAATVPVEVVARAHEWMQKLLPRKAGLQLASNLERMDEAYPDLAGIPSHMKIEVVATQPVPAEWFEEGLPEPAGVVELVPSF